MPSSLARNRIPPQATYILKVVPFEGKYLCGICRRAHFQLKGAESCLAACWRRTRDSLLVSPRMISMGRVIYRCLLCSRDFMSENEAHLCVEDCVAQYDKRLQGLLKGLGVALPPRAPQRFAKLAGHTPRRFDPSRLGRLRTDEDEAAAKEAPAKAPPPAVPAKPEDSQALVDEGAAADASPAAAPEAADLSQQKKVKEHKKRRREDYPKPWVRKNAEYECNVCNSRFFTKNETEQCFNSHFDEAGNYKEKEAA